MRRLVLLILVLIMIAGISYEADAALTFDVDFWSNSSDKNGPGDIGKIILLSPGGKINIDIFFSTDLALVAASWDLKYSQPQAVSVQGTTPPGSFWVLPLFELSNGSVKFQAAVFPGSTITGNNVFFGSIVFQSLGPGLVDLNLTNYLGFLTETGQDNFGDVHLGTINYPIPIPGAIWLLGTGLVGLFLNSKKYGG
jgi:hypothetical protein